MSQAEPERRKQTRRKATRETKIRNEMKMKNDLMAEAKLHDVLTHARGGWEWEGELARERESWRAAGLKRCGGIHPIAIIYLSHVECVSTSTQRQPNHRATTPAPSSAAAAPHPSPAHDHPLGRDLWQCCRSVVINIYYVTCMQSTVSS